MGAPPDPEFEVQKTRVFAGSQIVGGWGQDFRVGLDDPGLVVKNPVSEAELLYDGLSLFKIMPGHVGKQVVLNLVVQASIDEVGEGMGAHVTGSYHLLPQKAHLRVQF